MISKQQMSILALTLLGLCLSADASFCPDCELAKQPVLLCVKNNQGDWRLKAAPQYQVNEMIKEEGAAYPGSYGLTEFCREEPQLRGRTDGGIRRLQGMCERSGDMFVPVTNAMLAPSKEEDATFLAPKKSTPASSPATPAPTDAPVSSDLGNGFAEKTCAASDWVPLDNTQSPTGNVRCCAGKYGTKGNDWGKCDTSSCVNNFNGQENRNCENYGAPSKGNNPNGGSVNCPFLESDKAICDTSFYDDMNPVQCRTNPAGKNFQTHCLGKVKCNTVGVTVPRNGHSDGTAAYDSSGNQECLGAQFGFKAGMDCFYDGFSEKWKVCDPGAPEPTPAPTLPPTTPSPTLPAATPNPTNAPTPSPTKSPTPSPTASPTRSPTDPPTDSPTKSPTPAPTKETFNVGETVEVDGKTCVLQDDCSCDDTPSGAKGDPHFIMFNGRHFEFQGGCDLVLVDVPEYNDGEGLKIHIRTKIDTWFSYIERVAVQIGQDILEVKGGISDNQRAFWYNGEMQPIKELTKENGQLPFKVGGNQVHYEKLRKGITWVVNILLPKGQSISLRTVKDYMRVDVNQPKKQYFGSAVGMMGTLDGDGEMLTRDGNFNLQDENEFGLEWQVRDTEPMLFVRADGPQYPQKCQMPSSWWKDPASVHRRLAESSITQEEAAEACGRLRPSEREDCIFDVVATNDLDIAAAY